MFNIFWYDNIRTQDRELMTYKEGKTKIVVLTKPVGSLVLPPNGYVSCEYLGFCAASLGIGLIPE